MEFALETVLPRQVDQGHILDDQGIRLDMLHKPLQQPGRMGKISGREHGIEGHMDPHPLAVGQFGQGGQLRQGEILGLGRAE